ncbi:MAG: exosortase A [Magnetospiraceae bacterium]
MVTTSAPAPSPSSMGWITANLLFAVALAAIGWLYWGALSSMAVIWWNTTSYQHCMLVVAVVAIMILLRRRVIAQANPRLNLFGALIVFAASIGWLLGWSAGANIVQHFAMVLLFQGLVLALYGWQVTRRMAFPMFYLYFAVPVGDVLIAPLQSITADIVVYALQVLGVPVFREGYLIQTPSADFHVAEACSGLKYLVSFVALSALLAGVFFRTTWKRLVVLVFGVIVPILANMVRATAVVLTVIYSDGEYGAGQDHIQAGRVLYAAILLGFIFICARFMEAKPLSADSVPAFAPPLPATRLRAAPLLILLLAFAPAPIYAYHLEQSLASPTDTDLKRVLGVPREWEVATDGASLVWPEFVGATGVDFASYRQDGMQVDIAVALFDAYRPDVEIAGVGDSLFAVRPWSVYQRGRRTVASRGKEFPVIYQHVGTRQQKRVSMHWYWLNDETYANPWQFKLARMIGILLGREGPGGLVVISSGYRLTPNQGVQTIRSFLKSIQGAETAANG